MSDNKTDLDRRKEILDRCRLISSPVERLEEYHRSYQYLPKQGSSEWKTNRKIGASSAASILGLNNYCSIEKTALQMCGLLPYDSPKLMTEWGHLFEPVAKLFLGRFIKIYEFGSIPGFGIMSTKTTYTSCSPDGIFIMTEEANEYIDGKGIPGRIMLLEIKCPFQRKIADIPSYYYPQLHLGARTADICEGSLFCEFVFRVCSLCDLNFSNATRIDTNHRSISGVKAIGVIIVRGPKHNIKYNKVAVSEIVQTYKISAGEFNSTNDLLDCFDDFRQFIILYDPTFSNAEYYLAFKNYFGSEYNKKICQYLHHTFIEIDGIDFGAMYNMLYDWVDSLDTLIDIINNQDYSLEYLPLVYEKMSHENCAKHFNALIGDVDKNNIIGVIPYKLFDYRCRIVEKIPYVDEIKRLIMFGKMLEDVIHQGATVESVEKMCAYFK